MKHRERIYRVTFFDMRTDIPADTGRVRAASGPAALLRAYALREGEERFQMGECEEIAPNTWGFQILLDGVEVAAVVGSAVPIDEARHGLD